MLLPSSGAAAPTHLVVLQHGLYGSGENLIVLDEKLCTFGTGSVLVHRATCNEGLLTRDGIEQGGLRLAEVVSGLAEQHPSLERISFVGNSLGGLYVRSCATVLHDSGSSTGTMAGLVPDALVTTGCPHLGVRRFTYLPLPRPVRSLGRFVAGRTADELLLRDRRYGTDGKSLPLLVEMSQPDSPHGAALRAFGRRRAYANIRGDFMVPFGTAAMEDAKLWGPGYADARRAADFLERPGTTFRDAAVLANQRDGVAVVLSPPSGTREEALSKTAAAVAAATATLTLEEQMQRGLSSAGWSKAAVSFRGATTFAPTAHNKLVALRRDGLRRALDWVEQSHAGEGVMEHVARYLLGGET
jgi:hypothetical protein